MQKKELPTSNLKDTGLEWFKYPLAKLICIEK